MKLLLVCIDGLRLDIALPEALQRDPGFTPVSYTHLTLPTIYSV